MTETQFFTILGTIWLAPYVNKWYAIFIGFAYMFIVICKHLGWL